MSPQPLPMSRIFKPGLEIELGCDQPQLVLLGLLQALVVVEEVGARVLHALIEEQLVEVVAEIVVVRDVLLRLADRIGLLEALQAAATCLRSTFCIGCEPSDSRLIENSVRKSRSVEFSKLRRPSM